jgi:hypothetical protein
MNFRSRKYRRACLRLGSKRSGGASFAACSV